MSRRTSKMTIPLAIVAGFAPPMLSIIDQARVFGLKGAGVEASKIFTGWNPETGRWEPGWLKWGAGPIVIGFLAHKLASMIGINRALARMKIPLIRI